MTGAIGLVFVRFVSLAVVVCVNDDWSSALCCLLVIYLLLIGFLLVFWFKI